MITLVIFTFKRNDRLLKCLQTIDSKNVNEILIFNDDESSELSLNKLGLDNKIIRIFNPSDWGFSGRKFRKPIYLNKAIEMAKNNKILFSDDDGKFSKGTIDLHHDTLDKFRFTAGAIIRNRFFNRISKSILQGTNYSFQKHFYNKIGGYDEEFVNSNGSGDIDFWYRIYKYVQHYKLPVAYLEEACQKVFTLSKRKNNKQIMDPKKYTLKKHGIKFKGPMYKWFPEIRNKSSWMEII